MQEPPNSDKMPVLESNLPMSEFRMIAIDLDGTLLGGDGQVSDRVRRAIHELIAGGWIVCFATGRSYLESRSILEAVGHFDHAVFIGGAAVIDTQNQVTLHQQKMEPQLARSLCRILEDLGHAALALQDNRESGVDYLATARTDVDPATLRWMEACQLRLERVPSLADYEHQHTIRVGMVGPQDQAVEAHRQIQETFAEGVLVHRVRGANGVEILECFDSSVNKWEGIKHVARHHNIELSRIIAVGDDLNDLAMVKQAGLGVAMGNGRPELKAVAKRVIGSHREDGLAIFLEELLGEVGSEENSKL